MPSPQFATNPYIRIGSLGVLRCTTKLDIERTSNAKVTPTTTGEVGFSSGIPLAELSLTVLCVIGSSQQRQFVGLYDKQEPFDYDYFDGNLHHVGRGILSGCSVSGSVNEVVEYSVKISAADGKTQ